MDWWLWMLVVSEPEVILVWYAFVLFMIVFISTISCCAERRMYLDLGWVNAFIE
jgi:hypothetical protein